MSGLRLELSPSPGLAALILALHGAAGLSVLAVLPGIAGTLLAAGLVALGAASAWSRALLRSAASVVGIEFEGPGIALSYVTRFVVALPVRRPRRTILVTRGMLAPGSFRALRLWALWGKIPGVADKRPPA